LAEIYHAVEVAIESWAKPREIAFQQYLSGTGHQFAEDLDRLIYVYPFNKIRDAMIKADNALESMTKAT
jgi:hypothetical protein